jgi:hypothetical protein
MTTTTPTAELKLSTYILDAMSGSDITRRGLADTPDNYDPMIAEQYWMPNGGRLRLTSRALRDLAEWCGDFAIAEAQGGNPSGARSLRATADRALALAQELDR